MAEQQLIQFNMHVRISTRIYRYVMNILENFSLMAIFVLWVPEQMFSTSKWEQHTTNAHFWF